MPKGTGKKPDVIKSGESKRPNEVTVDELSVIDRGFDFVKAGETPKGANRT